jgi:hypothetical protein
MAVLIDPPACCCLLVCVDRLSAEYVDAVARAVDFLQLYDQHMQMDRHTSRIIPYIYTYLIVRSHEVIISI